MTELKKGNGILLARVTSKAKGSFKRPNRWVYTLSTGHKISFTNDCLSLKQWYFFEMQLNALTQKATFVSCEAVDTDAAEKLGVSLADLHSASVMAENTWKQLEASDRAIVMQTLGMGASALAGGGLLIGGISAIGEAVAVESILGVCTGGLSLAIGGAFAGMSYLQYEARKESLANHTKVMAKYRNYRNLLARNLIRTVPAKYQHLELLDPDFSGICTHMKAMIDNFSFGDLFAVTDENYAYATA